MPKLTEYKNLDFIETKKLNIDFDSEEIKVLFKINNLENLKRKTVLRIGKLLEETVEDLREILTSNYD